MTLHTRNYRDEDDYWRMRAFLRETFGLYDRRERNWLVVRLDYWRWHCILNCNSCAPIEQVTQLWETADGILAAFMCPDNAGEVFMQTHPAHLDETLLHEMISAAEARLAIRRANGKQHLTVWAQNTDTALQGALAAHGYALEEGSETQWRCDVTLPVPDVPIAAGYTVRSLGDVSELPSRSWASWRAFHPDEPADKYEGWEWYHNIQRQPLYRRDLDIVAAAPTGEVAAFTTIWYDDVTRSAMFEPVGTMPEHQQRGLGKAIMNEGLRRLQRMGATVAFVGGYSVAANALYRSVMGSDHDLMQPWVREW